uniref:Cytochrome b561 domain-containing protein n=1 Tax=Mycena chlorophos TaxID=658473 RepID=A0ABQ0LXL4_MYCCL|nr:predicted protein [Mycena chlorophos]
MAKGAGGIDYHDKMIIAHAVFASIATLITAPAAILTGRYFRNRPWWFKTHLYLQSITAACIFLVFVVGSVAVKSGASHSAQFIGPKRDAHHDLGLAVFILLMSQYLLGVAAHFTHSAGWKGGEGSAFPTLTTPKHLLRHVHVFCGVAMTALLYAGVKTGMDEWNMVSDMGTLVPTGIVVVYWVIFGIEVAVYLFGWLMEPIRAGSTKSGASSIQAAETDEKVDEAVA